MRTNSSRIPKSKKSSLVKSLRSSCRSFGWKVLHVTISSATRAWFDWLARSCSFSQRQNPIRLLLPCECSWNPAHSAHTGAINLITESPKSDATKIDQLCTATIHLFCTNEPKCKQSQWECAKLWLIFQDLTNIWDWREHRVLWALSNETVIANLLEFTQIYVRVLIPR